MTKADVCTKLKDMGVVLSSSKLKKTALADLQALLDAKLAERSTTSTQVHQTPTLRQRGARRRDRLRMSSRSRSRRQRSIVRPNLPWRLSRPGLERSAPSWPRPCCAPKARPSTR
jgi:hypothetical protein